MIFSLAEGEFNTLVIGVEVVSFSDEVDSLSSISVVLVGMIFSLAEGEFNTLVIGVEVVSFSDEVSLYSSMLVGMIFSLLKAN